MEAWLEHMRHLAPEAAAAWAGWLIHSTVHIVTHTMRRVWRSLLKGEK